MAVLLLAVSVARAATIAPAADELWLATSAGLQRVERNGASVRQPLPASLKTPLGSSWKLFMYLYLAEQEQTPPDYRCDGRRADEVFCCTPGQSVDAERALVQSCAPYFEAARLGVTPAAWRRFWQPRAPQLAWLGNLAQLQPGNEVAVAELLAAVRAAPPAAAQRAQAALLGLTLDGRGAGAVRYFGSGLRVKTWTWDRPDRPREKMGGFVGWLADGSVAWTAVAGPSTTLFRDWSPQLAPVLERRADEALGRSCVRVNLFERYPLRRIHTAAGQPAPTGVLHGRYLIDFQRGTRLTIDSAGELELVYRGGVPRVSGRFALNDYVARVLEREAAATPVQAARALAIAARSYVVQNADHVGGCYQIADSSARQRMAPRPPSAAALAVARWTDGLILTGEPVQYHRDRARRGMLSWQAALQKAQQGAAYTDILASAFPAARLASLHAPDSSQCLPLLQAARWLYSQQRHWERQLRDEAGFEMPGAVAVCQLGAGRPQVDLQRRRIFIRGLQQQEDRLSLAHEWLHLAFAWHPRGRDEFYIEALARRLEALPDDWN